MARRKHVWEIGVENLRASYETACAAIQVESLELYELSMRELPIDHELIQAVEDYDPLIFDLLRSL